LIDDENGNNLTCS